MHAVHHDECRASHVCNAQRGSYPASQIFHITSFSAYFGTFLLFHIKENHSTIFLQILQTHIQTLPISIRMLIQASRLLLLRIVIQDPDNKDINPKGKILFSSYYTNNLVFMVIPQIIHALLYILTLNISFSMYSIL